MFVKNKILIIYNYFTPAFKAGGPIQSIANLIENLGADIQFYILTSCYEIGEVNLMRNIEPNKWIDYEKYKAQVFYISKDKTNKVFIRKLITEINPDKILVNGIYSIPFSLIPAWYFPGKTIMHIRGMLHPGALGQKSLKKKLFLNVFKLTGLHKKISFCVSDKIELEYLKVVFGDNTKAFVAGNFPKLMKPLPPLPKLVGELKIVSIALISPMKNHLMVLEALASFKNFIEYDIYGPIKDKMYWNKCFKQINKLPSNIKVNYKGEIKPLFVNDILAKYHAFVLLSQSENFGHALFEAMSAGKPIITSNNTPWNNLEENDAGYNVDLTIESIANSIKNLALSDQVTYNNMVKAVQNYAAHALNLMEIKQQHFKMFSYDKKHC